MFLYSHPKTKPFELSLKFTGQFYDNHEAFNLNATYPAVDVVPAFWGGVLLFSTEAGSGPCICILMPKTNIMAFLIEDNGQTLREQEALSFAPSTNRSGLLLFKMFHQSSWVRWTLYLRMVSLRDLAATEKHNCLWEASAGSCYVVSYAFKEAYQPRLFLSAMVSPVHCRDE